MRVENTEQGFRDFGKFVVDFEMNARGQKREGFNETLDMRIFATVGIEKQTRGDFRIFLGELRAHLAKIG
jgi:hypothetical protein